MFHYHSDKKLQCCVIKAAEVEEYVSTKSSLVYLYIKMKTL
jgi:hypothetical protein